MCVYFIVFKLYARKKGERKKENLIIMLRFLKLREISRALGVAIRFMDSFYLSVITLNHSAIVILDLLLYLTYRQSTSTYIFLHNPYIRSTTVLLDKDVMLLTMF